MNFQTSVRTCLTQKYATFQGRASRSEYWWFFLAYFVGAVVIALTGIGILYLLYILAMIVPVAAAGWRRLQDTGRPGWYILIPVAFGLVSMLLTPTMPDMDPTTGAMTGEMPSAGGMGLVALLGLIQLVLAVVYIWWLTRPSQPETNEYGPPPQA